MTQYLLAAEADKIQDLIFRASHLREVVGGSQLLSRFCKEVPPTVLPPDAQIIINDGGSFRLLFDDPKEAITYGQELAEVYRLAMGGTLTVAPLVEVNGDFQQAAIHAHDALRQAKQHQAGFTAAPHFPYVAFCVSCGVGLAVEHSQRHPDERAQFLCADCRRKVNERVNRNQDNFVVPFVEQVIEGSVESSVKWPHEPDEIAGGPLFDPRNYVAYIIADGNEMGQVFGQCKDPDDLRTLSTGLTPAMHKSLAQPTRLLMRKQIQKQRSNFVPVLPLILAGDDLFVLLPAPWALDFARRFAVAYEKEVYEVVKFLNVAPPTVAVAVVICKAKYPYYLAHQRGEELLKQAKQVSKQQAMWGRTRTGDKTFPRSIVTFDIILGSRLTGAELSGDYRPTLRPYWVSGDVPDWGISLDHLIRQRYALRRLPRKRLAQLHAHFDALSGIDDADKLNAWSDRLERLLGRIAYDETYGKAIADALEILGGRGLYTVRRTTDRKTWYGHALSDLLDAWDFTFDLKKSQTDYEE